MPSRESREYLQELRKRPAFGAVGNEFDLDALRKSMEIRQAPANGVIKCIRSQIDGMPCEWVVAPDADPDLRLLYLHGGGYVFGSPTTHRQLGAAIALAAQASVFVIDYRLAPEYPFPAALDDAMSAYRWLIGVTESPSDMAVAGDSAGGGLAVASLMAARDEGLPPPAACAPSF